MLKRNFGTPDPLWDYNYLWQELINAHTNLESLIVFISNIEDSTPEDNEVIAAKLQSIQALLGEAKKACYLPSLNNLLE